ncbi:unnamed protein product [Orchesella dallaii]|uniref:Uncharacterized protein n=1 Tax=Orchesella dallaii TaxID=48710 RepID=A0ABP1QW73_9HEXA
MRSWSRMLRHFFSKSCRGRLLRFTITVAVVTNIGASLWIMISERSLPEYFNLDAQTNAHLTSQRHCFIPTLNPLDPEIKMLISKPPPIDCAEAANPTIGKIAFEGKQRPHSNLLVQKLDVGAPCCYRPFYRVSDSEVWLQPTKNSTYVCHQITERETAIPPEYEFIEIICGFAGSKYKDAIAFASRKTSVEKRILKQMKKVSKKNQARFRSFKEKSRNEHKLSVIILGLESTSQMNFIRMMPKSHSYVVNTLSAVQLRGHNKVGENALPNVIPLLTGRHLSQMKSTCVDQNQAINSAIHLDDCPFIWKNFSAKGYRTSFVEDETSNGVFNSHWSNAFGSPPTDHYFRTFFLRTQQNHASYEGLCQGTRMTFETIMQYTRDIAETYQNDPLFLFTWSSKLSRDDFNRLAWGDSQLLSTLKFLNSNNHLNNTALILVGGHGSRNEEVRRTHQGQMEDRLPLAYIVLPEWFQSTYPRAWENLQENSEKLTTAFDIHETLKDLLDLSQLADPSIHYERQANKRFKSLYGSSLFMKIPDTRGCIAAGIPQQWCICYRKTPILTDTALVKSAARFAIQSFNKILKPYHRICEPLRLFQVTRALQWKPDDFENVNKKAGDEEYKMSTMIQLSFTALPGYATFEITLMNHPEQGFKLTDEIVRLNRYEEEGNCIHQDLKILCYCKKMSGNSSEKSNKGK